MKQTVRFENLNKEHVPEITRIYNYYVENSYAAYFEKRVPQDFFCNLLEMTKGYPAYTIISNEKVIGFCFLRAYNQSTVFSETAEITYFIDKDYSGKGIGKIILDKIEENAKAKSIHNILASISSLNDHSLKFHKMNGFIECGRFPGVGKKFGKTFDIIWMIKNMAMCHAPK